MRDYRELRPDLRLSKLLAAFSQAAQKAEFRARIFSLKPGAQVDVIVEADADATTPTK